VSAALRTAVRRGFARACAAVSSNGTGLRVLTYHRVNDSHPRDRLTVRSAAFASQMETLARSGRPVLLLGDAVAALRAATPMPTGAVAVTFDDGYADNAEVALPILERLSIRATFFVATGFMGTASTLDRYRGCCRDDGMMSWDQVRALRAAGHEVGGHGRTHRELATLSPEEARGEADGCARDIADAIGERPRLFCYPRGSTSAGVRRIVAEAGFEAACTVRPGANTPGGDLLSLNRTEVSGDDAIEDFRLKLDGGFDTWHRLVQRVTTRETP
jgi:peptidoglycan/xylan/chitin deacetylase (PgdA/CDA1 family)